MNQIASTKPGYDNEIIKYLVLCLAATDGVAAKHKSNESGQALHHKDGYHQTAQRNLKQ